ncbi:MAG: hypothetical protein Q8O55_07655 [Dehalococcoidales bacterium]|nr:hypothetical protein [Dehalococcoidales bacterium]
MEHINEYKHIGDKVVNKYNIIGTNLVVYNAWEPSSITGKHSSITTVDEKWYGKIGTSHVPPALDALPAGSDERIKAVHAYFEEEYAEAYRLIVEAFPEAATGTRDMGDIEILHK